MITFTVDGFTPCLKEIETGELYDTKVALVKRKSFLRQFNKITRIVLCYLTKQQQR